ncbi:hypothetical protein A0J61_10740 [Choanephora cucurbitarum]|uniref:Uncharacterized protein n=1 Tax=Choanephora cucurbitarum TaxID=101091 RepID=A0A1C7MWN4_9FUNG|nr:hypothetical protein A0J61_10740 [Choanephora cucurbitarum]
MSSENIPQEYFNCFNFNSELPPADPTEVEELQQDLYETAAMEWHHWQPGRDFEPKSKKAEAEPNLKRLMNFYGFLQTQHEAHKPEKHEKFVESVNKKISWGS